MLTLPPTNEPAFSRRNLFPVLYWNHVGLEMNRITHSLGGPQGGPTMSSRALGLLHLAMHDAFFAMIEPTLIANTARRHTCYLKELDSETKKAATRKKVGLENAGTLDQANAALTGAAITVLDQLYRSGGAGISLVANQTLNSSLSALIEGYQHHVAVLEGPHKLGVKVAEMIIARLAVKPGEPGADAGRYEPKSGRYYFRDEPSHPVRVANIDPNEPGRGSRAFRIYHGPFYGSTVESFAVTNDDLHKIAAPPVGNFSDTQDIAAYTSSLREVHALGGSAGLSTTTRKPDNTVAALYWAYDGPNLIGTPPRLYNQIVREVAWRQLHAGAAAPNVNQPDDHADLVRLFALCNTAMADSGKFAWKEKFRYEFWRPLSGIREHDTQSGPDATTGNQHLDADADPFWQALGAPETNSNLTSFKPPFPAYPSGHATFGAACFQMVRLFYGKAGADKQEPDNLGFSFVSDELNGVSRDLYQPYDPTRPLHDQPGLVRTRVVRRFPSLWNAIFENAFSRIWLGVHWNFDAFKPADAAGKYETPENITYSLVFDGSTPRPANQFPIGGVPLGLGIANDIFVSGMVEPNKTTETTASAAGVAAKSTNTTMTQAARVP